MILSPKESLEVIVMTDDDTVKKKIKPSRHQVTAARDLLNHMTQEELSRAAGVSRRAIVQFEAGNAVPQSSTLEKIQSALEARGIVFTNGDKPGVILDRSKAVIPL